MDAQPILEISGWPGMLLLIYAVGAVVALLEVDAPLWPRLGLAVLWPLGPMAFVITITILLLAIPIAFPVAGTLLLAAGLVAAVVGLRAC